jgi:adenylate cyclase class IV
VIHLFLKLVRKVEAANFAFVHLTAQEPGIYDKRHTDFARQDNWFYLKTETKYSLQNAVF